MSSLKGPDFQGCLSPAECGAEVWGTMKRAAAERLFQTFDYCRGGCFLPASPCAHLEAAECFLQPLLCTSFSGAEPRSWGALCPCCAFSSLRFAVLPLKLVLPRALLPVGLQKVAAVETVIIHELQGERFFCPKRFISDFVCCAKDSQSLCLVTVLACPSFDINKSAVIYIKLQP